MQAGDYSTIPLRVVKLSEKTEYFADLNGIGWEQVGQAIEFRSPEDYKVLRLSAKKYCLKLGADMVAEITDPSYSDNPHNNFVYYIWKRGAHADQVAPPPQPPSQKHLEQAAAPAQTAQTTAAQPQQQQAVASTYSQQQTAQPQQQTAQPQQQTAQPQQQAAQQQQYQQQQQTAYNPQAQQQAAYNPQAQQQAAYNPQAQQQAAYNPQAQAQQQQAAYDPYAQQSQAQYASSYNPQGQSAGYNPQGQSAGYNPQGQAQQPAVQGGQAQIKAQIIREFTCPHCQKKFQQYVKEGMNVLVCRHCSGRSQINQPPFEGSAGKTVSLRLKGTYQDDSEALDDSLDVLVKMLALDEACPIKFVDTGEFIYPKATIKKQAYQHLGNRMMNLVLLKEAVNDYKIIGNEIHGQALAPRRDELFHLKTLGSSYLKEGDWNLMDPQQRQAITRALYVYVDFMSKKLGV